MLKQVLLLVYILLLRQIVLSEMCKYIEDFTKNSTTDDWYEVSDTVREVGKSKGTIVIQQTLVFRRAIFFSLLNPQPNGAAFASVNKKIALDFTPYNRISLQARAEGNFTLYTFILRQPPNNTVYFANFFNAPRDFSVIDLKLDDFLPYYRGKVVNDSSVVLRKDQITSYGIEVSGGVYRPEKQLGVGSLEIDWIRASSEAGCDFDVEEIGTKVQMIL